MEISTKEQELFDFLLGVVKAKSPDTILRVAGGWVRDRVMGFESHDIDIACNNMSGLAFVGLICEHMQDLGLAHKSASVIAARPEQSKHLETAIFEIFGFSIDFANLRKESYAESRIPTIEVGTAFEDSHRRDLTINSLFFNINTGDIEDLTGRGLSDIQNKICRTPIDPIQTFLDDPLRILRAIRFACKYDLAIAAEVISAANEPSVREAFVNKLSKERIWAELVGISEGDSWKKGILLIDPVRGCELLQSLGLRDLLFKPDGLESWDDEQNNPHHDLDIWQHTLEALRHFVRNENSFGFEDQAVRVLSVILHDLGKCCPDHRQVGVDFTTYHAHEVASAKLAKEVLTSLNAPVEMTGRIVKLVGEHMRLHCLPANVSDSGLRRFVRDLGSDWNHSVDIAIADAYGKVFARGDQSIKEPYEVIRSRILGILENQGNVTSCVRPINGKELMVEFGIKPGPIVGRLFKLLDEELLERPKMDKGEAFSFIRERMIDM